MKNLLQSDFYRLFKSKSFYICTLVAVFLMSLNLFILDWSVKTLGDKNEMYSVLPFKDGISYGLSVFSNSNVLMILAIFSAIFVTAEFAHGTMKNAVSKGFNKLHIYLSKLVTVVVAGFILLFITAIVSSLYATFVTGSIGDFTGEYVGYIFKTMGIELLLNVALTAVLVMVAMVVKNLGGVIAIDVIGVLSLGSLFFMALEYFLDSKIKFTEFDLLNNIAFYFVNQTAIGSDYIRSVIVGLIYFIIASTLGIFIFKKADVK